MDPNFSCNNVALFALTFFLAPLILRLQSKNVFHGNRMFALWVWLIGMAKINFWCEFAPPPAATWWLSL